MNGAVQDVTGSQARGHSLDGQMLVIRHTQAGNFVLPIFYTH